MDGLQGHWWKKEKGKIESLYLEDCSSDKATP